MSTWIINRWVAFRSSFWFIPGLMLAFGLLLATVAPELERRLGNHLSFGLNTTAVTARATLTALCGAMFTVAGIVFSTTVVALSITSSQLGPRLLRNFLKKLVTQITLGCCLATSVYCLVLLRKVDELDGSVFVPELSLLLASVLGVATLIVIVFYIHSVAHSMQAQNVVSDVADDLDDAIRRLFPERIGEEPGHAKDHDSHDSTELASSADWQTNWEAFDDLDRQSVLAEQDGYLQAIDDRALMEAAVQADCQIRVLTRPGDYAREGQPLVEAAPGGSLDEAACSRLRAAFIVGNMRTPQQDVECAVNDLVEVAVRALSPGINDPFTAVACIDRLSSVLRRLAERKMPSGVQCDDNGKPRVVAKPRTFGSIVDAAFDQIRQNGAGCVAVTIRLLEAIEAIGGNLRRESDKKSLLRQADMIMEAGSKQAFTESDLSDLENRYNIAKELL